MKFKTKTNVMWKGCKQDNTITRLSGKFIFGTNYPKVVELAICKEALGGKLILFLKNSGY